MFNNPARPMRIAIDARKLHDFGIGTYIRNLVHELALLDPASEYGCSRGRDPAEVAAPAQRPRRRRARRCLQLRRALGVPVARAARPRGLSAPHYALPRRWPGPTVVTIHD